MDDNMIVDLFWKRSEKAISELANKYGPICMKVSMNILANYEDAEECVNDSYLGVWNAIPPKKPNPLLSFVCRIVRNNAISRYRKNNAIKRRGNFDLCYDELENYLTCKETVDEKYSEREIAGYIDEYLTGLSKINRMIFVRHFWYMDSYQEIAKLSGMRESAIRTRMSRLKKELKIFMKERGVQI